MPARTTTRQYLDGNDYGIWSSCSATPARTTQRQYLDGNDFGGWSSCSATPARTTTRQYLDGNDFGGLFRRLGWDNPLEGLAVHVETDDLNWAAEAEADKRGATVWSVAGGEIPPRFVQHQIV